jgi:hypothetical protein
MSLDFTKFYMADSDNENIVITDEFKKLRWFLCKNFNMQHIEAAIIAAGMYRMRSWALERGRIEGFLAALALMAVSLLIKESP